MLLSAEIWCRFWKCSKNASRENESKAWLCSICRFDMQLFPSIDERFICHFNVKILCCTCSHFPSVSRIFNNLVITPVVCTIVSPNAPANITFCCCCYFTLYLFTASAHNNYSHVWMSGQIAHITVFSQWTEPFVSDES